MTDPACAASEDGAEFGEQPKGRLKKLATKIGSERPNVRPKRWRDGKGEKGERQCKQSNEATLHLMLHLPPTTTTAAAATAAAPAVTAGTPLSWSSAARALNKSAYVEIA